MYWSVLVDATSPPPKGSSPNRLAPVIPFPKRKFKRTFYRCMRIGEWEQELCEGHPYAIDFPQEIPICILRKAISHMKKLVGLCAYGGAYVSPESGFGKLEIQILKGLCDCAKYCRKKRVTLTFLSERLKINYSSLREIIRDLAECSVIVNVGTKKEVNIAICPISACWDLRRVTELRKARNKKRRGPRTPKKISR